MISPELLRRFQFVAGLSHEQIVTLAKISNEIVVEADTFIFHEGDQVDKFYLVIDGAVAILFEVPDQEAGSAVSEQLTGELTTREIITSTVGTGNPFGWSGIIPPNKAFSSAKAIVSSKVIAVDCIELRRKFKEDPEFANTMILRAAQVIRERLRNLSIETLAFV